MPGKGSDYAFLVQVDFDPASTQNREAMMAGVARHGVDCDYVKMNARPGFPIGQDTKEKLNKGLRQMTSDSVLFVLGHGDWHEQKVGMLEGDDLADILVPNGLSFAKVIQVVACSAGRDSQGTADDVRLGHSHDSFASKFHQALMDRKRFIDVVAPTRAIGAVPSGPDVGKLMTKNTKAERLEPGMDLSSYRRERSFVRYTVVNGKQARVIVEWKNWAGALPSWLYTQ